MSPLEGDLAVSTIKAACAKHVSCKLGKRVSFAQWLTNLKKLPGQTSMGNLAYPPESLGRAISALFLSGETSKEAFRAKLVVLLYLLLDSGHTKVLSSFG